MLAAAVWHNVLHAVDVNESDNVSALDALLVINELGRREHSDPSTGALDSQIDGGGTPPFYDVNCDGFATALDALIVINDIGGYSFHPDYAFTAGEVTTGEAGNVTPRGCFARLGEGDSLRSELSTTLTISDDSQGFRLLFDAPEFDTTASGGMRDAFEVTVTDVDGNTVTQPHAPGRTAALNWSEATKVAVGTSSTIVMPAEASNEPHELLLNLSHLEPGSEITITARLINNDGDSGSSVVIRDLETVFGLGDPPQTYESEPLIDTGSDRSIRFDQLENVSSSLQAGYGRTSYTADRSQIISELTITNLGNQTVTGDLIVVIDRITDLETFAMNPDGLLADGRPFFNLTGYADGPLQPGESTLPREIRFTNPADRSFHYRLTTLAALNAAPGEFSTTPLDRIEAGDRYRYAAAAIDEDADRLSYSLVTGPENASVDSANGELIWDTTNVDIGNQRVTLRATDPYGLFVEQDFTIRVVETLQNRPPNFMTDPVTDAIASSGFEITTIATGDSPAGVGLISGFRGPRIVTANSGEQTVGVYAGENNDRFDDVTLVSTGEPQLTGAVLAGGYLVDVNLPPRQTSGDRFDVHGLDQGDLNGDGILDFVTLTRYRDGSVTGNLVDRYQVIATLGDGDGNFGEPIELVTFGNSNNPIYKNLILGDIDSDGELDVTLIRKRGVGLSVFETSLFTLLGNGDGTFSDVSEDIKNDREDGQNPLHDFKLVDLDQDGNLDLVGRDSNATQIGWRAGNGNGTFESFNSLYEFDDGFFPRLGRPYDIVDIDQDGDLDIAVGELGHTNILLNDGDQDYSKVGELAGRYPQTVSIADFSGDDNQDIFVGLQSGDGFLFVGDPATNSFTDSGQVVPINDLPANPVGSNRPVDVDDDGDLDLLLGSGSDIATNASITFLENLGDGTLEAHQYSPTPLGYAAGVLVGDYNGDGVNDLAHYTTDRNSTELNGVGILPGIRPGEFGGVRVNTIPSRTEGIVVADFDGDGILDYVLPGFSETYLGRGDGTFEDGIPAYSVPAANGIAQAADFNADGILDLLTFSGQNGLILLGIGDGTFEIGFSEPSDLFFGPTDLDVADINNDGFPDYFRRSTDSPNVVDILLNDATDPGRNFTLSQRIEIEARGENAFGFGDALAVADFDEDGIVDLATFEQTSEDPSIKLQVWRGNGGGTFTLSNEQFDYPDQSVNGRRSVPYILKTEDINEDGHADLVQFASGDVRVQLGNGDLTFGLPTIYATAGGERSLDFGHVEDLDGDGHLDLVYSDPRGYILFVRAGAGDGTFGEPLQFRNNFSGGEMGFGDLDDDGHRDIIFMNGNNPPSLGIFFGSRDTLVDMTTVDLDGDGNEEVLAINQQNDRVKLFVGDNLGGLTRQTDLFTGRGPVAIEVADLNGDGSTELITANRTGQSISVFTGNLDGGYTSTEISVGQTPIDLSSADINGDSFTDLLVADQGLNAVWVFSGNEFGELSDPVAIPLGDQPGQITIADATGDGQLDAVVTLPLTNRIIILAGGGSGAFAPPIYVATGDAAADIAVIDLNDDGNPDLIATIPDQNVVGIFYGRGQGQFAKVQNIRVGDQPDAIELADADEDGRSDIIVNNSGDDTVSVIYNRFDPNEVYRYDSDAIDPDDDALTYEVVDGPGGLFVNLETGEIFWAASPDQVGQHNVTLSAADGRGGVATQSFKIDVQPARNNSDPLIATESPTQIGAGDVFSYNVQATDGDADTLRYRLSEGPEGATIDPVSGELTWDGRDAAVSLKPYASTNSGGRIDAPVTEALRPASITYEGWYNLTALTASNGATTLVDHLTDSRHNALLVTIFGNRELQVRTHTADTGTSLSRFDFVPEVDRWYHFAITFDDASKLLTLYVDGDAIGAIELPGSLEFGEQQALQIGNLLNTRARIDDVRFWGVARTAEEIQEGISRHYDEHPNLLLDYRFEDLDTITIQDFSGNGHQGQYFPTVAGAGFEAPYRGPGLSKVDNYTFTIGVEDGRGGFDSQSFDLEVLPELRGSIAGHLFDDLNGDGDQDDGSEDGVPAESSLESWQLYIDSNGNAYPDPSELQTLTDADGNYRFDNLLPGDYPVRISPVAGFEVPNIANALTVTVSQETIYDLAVEQLALSHIRGQLRTEDGDAISFWKAYADLDGDRTRDENEPMAVSDRDGNYALTGLDAGTYTIRADTPAGWGDVAGRDGLSVTVAIDEVLADNDFVLRPTNTSVTGGVHFITTPQTTIEARQVFRYASVATGISIEAITYELSLAPDGMTVDPASGLVAWRPTIEQVGEHLVILRAANTFGSISLHDFTLSVTAPNTAPIISQVVDLVKDPGSDRSSTRSTAYVGLNYSHDIIAQDVESTTLTYALTKSPTGVTIDSVTGRINWTPAASDVGSHDFTAKVTDDAGDSTTAAWTVDVLDTAPTVLPLAVTFPRSTATVATNYLSRIAAVDQIGRPVTWSIASGPAGFAIDANGTIRWTPAATQLGDQAIELTATTADNVTETVALNIEVVGFALDAIPSIDSIPVTSVSLGQTFHYDLSVSDTDRDIFAFTLLEAPVGMSVHPSRGTIRWTPAADQLGESDVLIQVSDPSGATDEQSFKLKVSRFGGPPRIVSVPLTEASVGAAFLYSVDAIDREGDPLTYSLLAAPTGMTIVQTTGEVSWTPAGDQTGRQDVVIQVSDGIGGAATQAFVILVSDGVPNLPPTIVSSSPRFGAVGETYSYAIEASDPEGTTLTYTIGRGPDGLTIDAATGVATWLPAEGDVGQTVITLIATDADGASAIESFQFDVIAENRAPVINSTAPIEVTARNTFSYDILASDADVDVLRYELTDAPEGATIDVFGRIRWATSVALIGSHDFSVRVVDVRGGEATQPFTLSVIEDTIAPRISLSERPIAANSNVRYWEGPFTLYARATDNVAVASLTLSANGQDIPLSAAGTATFTFDDWTYDVINATATATDLSGNVTTTTISFGFNFSGEVGGTNEDLPTAVITTPTQDAAVVGMVSIVGTAADEDFAAYKLSYRRIDETTFTEFATGDTAVTDSELGVWDTSLLLNDQYIIRLEVAATTGAVNIVDINVGLAGELKLGNFQLSFTDMVIPVAGIPIEITRIYDTLQADREGDFGFGWRLEFRNTDLRVGLPKSGLEDIGIYSALRPGVKVYLNVPGQGRQGFTFNPDIRVLPGFGSNNLVLARPRFTPDPGVTSTLSTGISNYLLVNEQGELHAPGGIPYNPASPDFGGAYVLTTRDGITYRIDGVTGELDTATDRNGNQLIFTDNGIASDKADDVEIQRDSKGRITSISDLTQKSLNFQYNAAGELASVTDREDNITSFGYLDDGSHFLETIVDPLGREGARANYDENGRLVSSRNARGAETTFAIDPDNFVTEVSAQGRTLFFEYDNFGRVVSTTDLVGNQYRNAFDANGQLISTTDPLGSVTGYRRDRNGNATEITDAAGSTTRFTYDVNGNILTQVDALGQRTSFEYDDRGNVIRMTDAAGLSSTLQYDDAGNLIATTDARGQTRAATFDDFGNKIVETDALGNERRFAFDASGRQTANSALVQMPSGEITERAVSFQLDGNGNRISTTAPDGSSTSQAFDGLNRITLVTDQMGRETSISHDDTPTPHQVVAPGGRSVEFDYSLSNEPLQFTNFNGDTERYEYDQAGNLVRRILSDDTPDNPLDNPFWSYEYNGVQRQTAAIDPNGNRTEFEYDGRGNLVLTRDSLGGETLMEYDALGRLVTDVSPLGNTTTFEYDSRGYLTTTIFADGNEVTQVFDAVGNRVSVTDARGITSFFDYDAENRLVALVDGNANRTEYGRDQFGNVIVQRDALGRTTRHEFDEFRRQTATIRPSGARSEINYGADNKLETVSDFAGNETEYHYDDDGRLTRISYADGTEASFTLDGEGNIVQIVDAVGTTTFTYDAQQRLTEKVSPDGRFVRYQYDASSNIVSMTSPSGTTSYSYDSLHRLKTVTSSNSETTTYRYDADGNQISVAFGNGSSESRVFDNLNRLTQSELFDSSNSLILRNTFLYDRVGNVIRVEGSDGRISTFDYDDSYQLTGESHLTPELSLRTIRYEYDDVGNRVVEIDSSKGTTTYQYDLNDQLLSISGVQSMVFTHDAAGNQLTSVLDDQNQTRYQWDVRGRLIRAEVTAEGSTQIVDYQYDHSGNRIGRTDENGEVRFLIDSNRQNAEVIEEYGVDGVTEARFIIAEKVIGGSEGVSQFYVHHDFANNVYAITDSEGSSAGGYLHDAFGSVLLDDSTLENPFQFAGEYVDATTGLTYLRARHLDTSVGRFVSTDRFGGNFEDARSLHRYIYAHNNPNSFSDPSGNYTTLAQQVGVLSVVGITLVAFQQSFNLVTGLTETVNWAGISAGVSLNLPGLSAFFGGLSAGIQINAMATHEAPQNDNPRIYTRTNIGGSLTFFGSGSLGFNAAQVLKLPGLGVGGFSVEVPQLLTPRLLPSASLAGGYFQLSVTAAAGIGETLLSALWMGFGAGNASGLTFATLVGLEAGGVAGVSAPVFGQDSSFDAAERIRTLFS